MQNRAETHAHTFGENACHRRCMNTGARPNVGLDGDSNARDDGRMLRNEDSAATLRFLTLDVTIHHVRLTVPSVETMKRASAGR